MSRRLAAFLSVGAGVFALSLAVFATPDTVRIPKAKPHPPGAPAESALFSHWRHNAYRCYACHPSAFPQAPLGFTHADMNDGRYCGRCHNGREAKAVAAYRCEACHVAR